MTTEAIFNFSLRNRPLEYLCLTFGQVWGALRCVGEDLQVSDENPAFLWGEKIEYLLLSAFRDVFLRERENKKPIT